MSLESFVIKESKFGKGLFASRDIKAGEKILEFEGPIVDKEEGGRRDIKAYGSDLGNPLQIGENKYIYPGDPGRLANHSCNPNCGIKNDQTLVALRNIGEGEEITFDYSCTMDEDGWTLDCGCGESNCRGKIEDFKCLPKDLQQKYLDLGVVQNFIAKKFG